MELRNVMHKIRTRLQFDVLQDIDASQKHIKKLIAAMIGVPMIIILLGFISSVFLFPGIALLLLGLPFCLVGVGSWFEHNKKLKSVIVNKYTFLKTVTNHFSDEQQKLEKEEVKELLKLHLPEKQFQYLSHKIKQRGFIIYDDVFQVYSELAGDYEREEKYKNHIQSFLKEHDLQEHQLYASADNFISALPHVKQFNTRKVL